MRRLAPVLLVALACGCAGARPPPVVPVARDLEPDFAAAVEREQTGEPEAALGAWLDLLDQGVRASRAGRPEGREAVLAAADALVSRSIEGLGYGEPLGLALRVPGALGRVEGRLASAWDDAHLASPLVRAALARAELQLALHRGDAADAARWRERTGCVRRATEVGPVAWPPLAAIDLPTPLEEPRAALAATYAGVGPFSPSVSPTEVAAEGCSLALGGTVADGVRVVVVDVEVPHAQRIALSLRTASAATLVVGGQVVLTRPADAGGGEVRREALADAPAGRVRVVVRVAALGDAPRLELDVLDDDGVALRTSAPAVGDAAGGVGSTLPELDAATASPPRLLAVAAALALGDARRAEHLVETRVQSPVASLLFARAVRAAGDLPDARVLERARAAFDAVVEAWPGAWEAGLGRAQLTMRRRGADVGRIEALRDLASSPRRDPVVRAFEATMAVDVSLRDVARAAAAAIEGPLAGTALLAYVHDRVEPSVGADREGRACALTRPGRDGFGCLEARAARGDAVGVYGEIARLRELHASPTMLLGRELGQRVAKGDVAGALRVLEAMPPGERTLSTLGLLVATPDELRRRLATLAASAHDAPGAIAPLAHALGADPARDLEVLGRRLVDADRAHPGAHGAATVVLTHTEHYDLDRAGLLHWWVHDVRRVSGTTDVEDGVRPMGAIVQGRDAARILRRRVHKRDGRTVEPDRPGYAQQAHADLAQLEKGDYVEQVVEGFALPDVAGQLVVDTLDLMPERTSIADATIELRRPASLALSVSAHARLGAPVERADGDAVVTTWHLRDAAARPVEGGVPRMDRDVAVSFGTLGWREVGAAVGQAIAALDEHDPRVARWVRETLGARAKPGEERERIDAVVAAVGRAVRVVVGLPLSDAMGAVASLGGANGARAALELGQGSRAWLAWRALRELGIPAELVVAERDPWSADPRFVPHFGRFDAPLVVAHTPGGDVWLDLDVEGPPLPAGRVSPEIVGRPAMTTRGEIVTVGGASAADARDDVDVRLTLDAKGDARGTLDLVLRGRAAQGLADAFERVVGADREALLRGAVLAWLPWASVRSVSLASAEGSWEVSLHAEVDVAGFAEREAGGLRLPGIEPLHFVFPHGGVSTLATIFASRADRTSALAIARGARYQVHRRVVLPAGARVARAADPLDAHDARLDAARTGAVADGALDETFTLSLPTGTVPPDAYVAFAALLRRVDDAFLASTRVALP